MVNMALMRIPNCQNLCVLQFRANLDPKSLCHGTLGRHLWGTLRQPFLAMLLACHSQPDRVSRSTGALRDLKLNGVGSELKGPTIVDDLLFCINRDKT